LHFKRGTPVRKTKKLRAIIDPAAFGDGRIHHAAGQIGMTVEGFLSACCTLWLRASLTCPDGRLAGILAAQVEKMAGCGEQGGRFCAALVDAGLAHVADGDVVLHDWHACVRASNGSDAAEMQRALDRLGRAKRADWLAAQAEADFAVNVRGQGVA
jgi:hypothetical protein